MARGPSLVESCHKKRLHSITARWLTASGTCMQTFAPLGTWRRSCASALEGSKQQIHWPVPVSLQRSAEMRMRLGDFLPGSCSLSYGCSTDGTGCQRGSNRDIPSEDHALRWHRPAVWHYHDYCSLLSQPLWAVMHCWVALTTFDT